MPNFLTLDDVFTFHNDQIARYGGSTGLRDRGALESAIAQPEVSFGGRLLHGDLFEMAGAYLFHLVMNHPFVDGNKRAATVSALGFLFLNGYDVDVPEDDLVAVVLSVTEGKSAKPEIAAFLREHSKPLS